jgi:integrase
MATVKFRIRSKANKNVSISVYLSTGRGKMIEVKTTKTINPKDWSEKLNFPKQTIAENRLLSNQLKGLENFIFDELNKNNGSLINADWLQEKINEHFNIIAKTDTGLLVNHIQYIIDNANTRKVKTNGGFKIGLSTSTIKNYTLFRNIILEYQKIIKKQIQFIEISKPFVDKFTNWLVNTKKYSTNYSGKQLEILKTVCKDASKNEIPTTPYSLIIEHFRESDKERYIHTLSYSEIEKIKNIVLPSEKLNNARKWILIGCAIGQRGGDLLNITKENIRYNIDGLMYLDLIQQKTDKEVTISINEDYIIDIFENSFPKKIQEQKLNEYTKEVCKLASINELVKGKKYNIQTDRREMGIYPKYEFITSHCFRRSFVTNKYKDWNTPTIMDVTGHSKESLVQTYINKREDKDQKADLQRRAFENQTKDKKPQLKVIKNGTND